MPRRRARPEQQLQRAVFQHLRARGAPNVFAFHPANGGFRTPAEAAIFKGLGVVPGVPDVIIIRDGKTYALELKAEGGRVTPAQEKAIDDLRRAGADAGIAVGIDDALEWLEERQLLIGRTL
jgi:VRR-NUC domain